MNADTILNIVAPIAFHCMFATTVSFYILCDGFKWKPSRAVFIAPLGVVGFPIAMVLCFIWIIADILNNFSTKCLKFIDKKLTV